MTATTESSTPNAQPARSAMDAISYTDLYRRWEENPWKATAIDFSKDRDGWDALTDMQRKSAMWIYSMFFYGEESVAENLSPYIDAAPKEEQKHFLATQQVDEARHAVFFGRFFHEVLGTGESIAAGLAHTQSQLGWGYRGVFDRLDRMAEDLRGDRSLPNFARAIALYHLVVEATLAQPGQHYIEDFFMKSGTMPGFSEGMTNVARDEQRHIGFGVKTLSELFAESEECKQAVVELLREVLPYALATFQPPNGDREYTRCYGFELEDIYGFGLRSIKAKWAQTGYPVEDMPGVLPLDHGDDLDALVKRQLRLLDAGVLGEPNGKPDASPEVLRDYFETLEGVAIKDAAGTDPLTIQWRFRDAEPWYLRVDNGSTHAAPGIAPSADVKLDTSWSDWVEFSMHGGSPLRAVLKGKLRPRGSIADIRRVGKVFPPRPNSLG
jgi:ribonucleotide reductase beta subunit family protein with ferritin-like domain